jgi:ribosomal protein L40E
MFCHHCGSQIADDAANCIHCGSIVAPKTAAPPPPPPPPPPRTAAPGMMYCRHCGAQIVRAAFVCVHCGVRVGGSLDPIERALFPDQGKSWVVTLLLALFGGALGLHRFYVGKIATGILQLLTFGGFGIWWIIDLIMIVLGGFEDGEGRPLVK